MVETRNIINMHGVDVTDYKKSHQSKIFKLDFSSYVSLIARDNMGSEMKLYDVY